MTDKAIMTRLLTSIALSSLLLAVGCRSRVDDSPVVLTATQIDDRTRPATVAIVAKYVASGTVRRMVPDTGRLAATLREQSDASDTRKERLEKAFNILLADPERYLREGPSVKMNKTIGSLGTGFIVTPDGYILTNAHVVEPDPEDLKAAVVESLTELVADDVKALETDVEESLAGEKISVEATERLTRALSQVYAKNADFDFSKEVFALMPMNHSSGSGAMDPKHCEIEKVGKRAPGKDVAIIKIEGNDLPTVPLAANLEDGSESPGAELLVIGYPGKVALEEDFTLQSRMQPSLSIGHVSGIKDMVDGWQVIQTDTAINPGNSGGPALNRYGQAIGLATFALKDSQGLNFVVSIDVAHQFLTELNVHPRESNFTTQYKQALAEYDQPGHGEALAMFRALRDSHPESAAVADFVQRLSHQQQQQPQQDTLQAPTSSTSPSTLQDRPSDGESSNIPLLLFGGIAAFLLVIVGIVVLARRK